MIPTTSRCPFHLVWPSNFLCESCPSYTAENQDSNHESAEFDHINHIDSTSGDTTDDDPTFHADWELQQDFLGINDQFVDTYEDHNHDQDFDLDFYLDPAPDSATHTLIWSWNTPDDIAGVQSTQDQASLESDELSEDVSSRESSITEDKHTCPKCNMYFSRTYNCRRHIRSCLSQDEYSCTICKKYIKRMDNMVTHCWRQHRSCRCAHPKCQSMLILAPKSSVAICDNKHTNFVCNICGKAFTVEEELGRHKTRHG